jgi:hypothetical protein
MLQQNILNFFQYFFERASTKDREPLGVRTRRKGTVTSRSSAQRKSWPVSQLLKVNPCGHGTRLPYLRNAASGTPVTADASPDAARTTCRYRAK